MWIKDGKTTFIRCDRCHAHCGNVITGVARGVFVGNRFAAELCASCVEFAIEHVQKLLTPEALTYYRELIDSHGQYRHERRG